MISDFLKHLRAAGYSESTIDVSKRWLGHFESRQSLPVTKLRSKHLTAYHQSLTWEPGPSGKMYSKNSVNQAVGVLRTYFRWCVEQGEIKKNPAEHLVTRRPPKQEPVVLTTAQARALLERPDLNTPNGLRDRAILGLFVEERASSRSVCRLNLSDFQPDTGALLLRGRKRRIACLTAGLQADLERYLRLGRAGVASPGEEAFFVSQRGTRMCGNNALRILQRYCDEADVPRPTLYR